MASITIDGKEYDTDTLSDEAKSQLMSLQFCDAELQRLQAEAAAFQTARIQYARALQKELQKPQNPGTSFVNGKDNLQAEPEKKKGLMGFFGKK
jgi:hypothetical protein